MTNKHELTYWKSQLDSWWLETMSIVHKGKDIDKAINEAFGYLICDEIRLKNSELADFKRLVNAFLINQRYPKVLHTNRLDLSKI